MNNKKNMVLAGVEFVHALLLILAVKVFVPVCDGIVKTAAGKEIPMKCHYTSHTCIIRCSSYN